ncbi:MAG: DUF4198 domain-containing protein [Planctomycetota bacterium]|nr:DUF4198 domain-containing protein [Planctomycetota bacterium]
MHFIQTSHNRQQRASVGRSLFIWLQLVIVTSTATTISLMQGVASAHDTWVQSGSLGARTNDVVYVDLMLGNHGNNHRDFKLASKITIDKCTLNVKSPNGKFVDLKPSVVDFGSAPKEGYWSAKFDSQESGIYEVLHTLDTLHGTIRAVKTAKTYVLVSNSPNDIAKSSESKPIPINKNLEIVLETPIQELSANHVIECAILKNGKPRPGVRVSFIPRGAQLADEMDPKFEKISNETGRVAYTPEEGNLILIVAHDIADEESGEGYEKTYYGATLVLPVPKRPLLNSDSLDLK